jgi:hypothetical protein
LFLLSMALLPSTSSSIRRQSPCVTAVTSAT